MAQRHQAAVADKEVQACRENRRDEDLAGEIDVEGTANERKTDQRNT